MTLPLLACLLLLGSDAPRVRPEPLGTFDPRAVPEASGVVRSRRHPGVFWVHNDSGNPPRLLAVRRDGSLIRAFDVAAPNLDWEDVAADDRGRLFVGDIGDNKGLLRLRVVYILDEPDPALPSDGPLRATGAFFLRPGGDCYDAEALVVEEGRAVLVTKRTDGREAELREVPIEPPSPLLRPAPDRKLGVLAGFVEPATGADLTPDGRLLAVCGVDVVRVYERPAPPSWDGLRLVGEVRLKGKTQVEGIAWDGRDLILASEHGGMERLAEDVWKSSRPGAKRERRR